MRNPHKLLTVIAVAGLLLSFAATAIAHSPSGTKTNADGCVYHYYDIDGLQAVEAADMYEVGSTCDYVRAKIKVLESGSWVYRQDTDVSHSFVAGVNSTDLDWVSHQWKKAGQWRAWSILH